MRRGGRGEGGGGWVGGKVAPSVYDPSSVQYQKQIFHKFNPSDSLKK